MNRRLPLFALAAFAALALAACTGRAAPPAERVFLGPPWTGDERLVYDLLAGGREPYGTCVLETDVDFEPGKTKLSRLCSDGAGLHRDDGISIVDSQTLEPVSSERIQVGGGENRHISFTATYADTVVTFEANRDGTVRQTERPLPQPTEENPDPAFYDDETMLWLIRGIDLRTGYEGTYRNASAATVAVFDVTVYVEAEEEVTVPAGTFLTARMRISTATTTQFAWVEVAAPHRLIKARIHGFQDVVYLLREAQQP